MANISLTLLVYLVGTFFVIIFAARIFNDPTFSPDDEYIKDTFKKDPKMSPALPIYLAEKTRYRIYSGLFIIFTVAFYYFISLAFPLFVSNIVGNNEVETNWSIAMVVGTLAFIAGSTKIPFAKEILAKWKEDLHRQARIPDAGMYVFNSLRFGEINKSTEQFKKNLDAILNSKIAGKIRSDIEKDYFYFDKSRIERKWARLVYLVHAIEQWSENSQFERHLKSESLKWLALRSYYTDILIPEMKRYRQGDLQENDIEAAKDDIDRIALKIYWLITLLLFMANKAEEDPCIHLKRIGWIVTPEKYFNLSNKQIIFTGTVIFLSISLGAILGSLFLLSFTNSETAKQFNIDPNTIFVWMFFGIPMFTLPLVVTMYAKRMLSMKGTWSVQRPEQPAIPFLNRQWDIYFVVGAVSYATTLFLMLAIYFLYGLINILPDGNHIFAMALYSGLAFVTSMFISYLIDTPDPGWETNWHYYLKNLVPAISQGLTNVFLVTFIFLLVKGSGFNIFALEPDQKGKLMVYGVIVFIIGIAMNYSSRIGTKFYERRENGVVRSTKDWWTISVDSITKRVKTVKLSENLMEIVADDELKDISDVGDAIEFFDRNKLAMTGKVEKIHDDLIQVILPA